MNRNIKKILWAVLVFGVLGFAIFLSLKQEPIAPLSTDAVQEMHHAELRIGAQVVDLPFQEGETLYTALVHLRNAGSLHLVEKEYPSLGIFITEIGTMQQGVGGNLMYFINKKEAQAGVSSYLLKNGDRVEWKLQ